MGSGEGRWSEVVEVIDEGGDGIDEVALTC